jgi:hypothetical protein
MPDFGSATVQHGQQDGVGERPETLANPSQASSDEQLLPPPFDN